MSVRIIAGDCRDVLRTLADQSVHCCVTSPPYFGLRDYGCDGQIGLEQTPAEYVEQMVAVFREVRRVLRPDGTLWLNLGDSYAGSWGAKSRGGPPSSSSTLAGNGHIGGGPKISALSAVQVEAAPKGMRTGSLDKTPGLKPKDLIGIPWRVAFALQQPYYTGRIRSELDRIWLAAMIDAEGCLFIHKRKAGTDSGARYTKADGTAVSYARTADTYGVGLEICNTSFVVIERILQITGVGTFTTQGPDQNSRRRQTIYRWRAQPNECKRIVQEVYPHLVAKQHQARILLGCPSSGERAEAAHQALMGLHRGTPTDVDFAAPESLFQPGYYLRQDVIWSKPNAMPESVRDRCTKAHEYVFLMSKSERYYWDTAAMQEPSTGLPPGSGLGAYAERMRSKRDSFKRDGSKREEPIIGQAAGTHRPDREESDYPLQTRNKRSVWTIATQPFSEAHFATMAPDLAELCIKAGCPDGGMVLDPFGGAGTTALVADRLQRDAVLIELNAEYIEIARRRIAADAPLFAEVADGPM